MPSPSEIQELAPLFFQLLFFAVAGAILVGSVIAIIKLMYKFSIIRMYESLLKKGKIKIKG